MKKIVIRKSKLLCVVLLVFGISILPITSGSIENHINDDMKNHPISDDLFSPVITHETYHDVNMKIPKMENIFPLSSPKDE